MKIINNLKYKSYVIVIVIVCILVAILFLLCLPNIRLDTNKKILIDYKNNHRIVASNIVASVEDVYSTYYINTDKDMIIVTNDRIDKIFISEERNHGYDFYSKITDYNKLNDLEQYYYQILLTRLNIPQEDKLKDCGITIYHNFRDNYNIP